MTTTQTTYESKTMTSFQNEQATSIRKEEQARKEELKALGAVARIGFFHYPGKHSNLNTQDSLGKVASSRSVAGDNPIEAIRGYAKSVWGEGKLRSEGRIIHNDGTYEESFLVITK